MTEGSRIDLRADLLDLLRERGIREMNDALFQEATKGNKSSNNKLFFIMIGFYFGLK